MIFQFKKFSIQQQKAAMKIGTDAVLLGAWTPINHRPFSILDIGTGTGIIALMLAQRTAADQIDGIEIEENAYEQTVENFENSPYNDRLFCYHASVQELATQPDDLYDLIVCNPPFFTENYFSDDEKRNLARFESSLPFEELLHSVEVLLATEGVFSVIIPFAEEKDFINIARKNNLFPFQITRTKGTFESPIKRSLIAFAKKNSQDVQISELIIEHTRHNYTDEYIQLTKDFYLKM